MVTRPLHASWNVLNLDQSLPCTPASLRRRVPCLSGTPATSKRTPRSHNPVRHNATTKYMHSAENRLVLRADSCACSCAALHPAVLPPLLRGCLGVRTTRCPSITKRPAGCVPAENIWPHLQTQSAQASFRPPRSSLAQGDLRVDPFVTTYNTQYHAPYEHMKKIRSPMRNPDLAQATDLQPLYLSSFNRVTECAPSLSLSAFTASLLSARQCPGPRPPNLPGWNV